MVSEIIISSRIYNKIFYIRACTVEIYLGIHRHFF